MNVDRLGQCLLTHVTSLHGTGKQRVNIERSVLRSLGTLWNLNRASITITIFKPLIFIKPRQQNDCMVVRLCKKAIVRSKQKLTISWELNSWFVFMNTATTMVYVYSLQFLWLYLHKIKSVKFCIYHKKALIPVLVDCWPEDFFLFAVYHIG